MVLPVPLHVLNPLGDCTSMSSGLSPHAMHVGFPRTPGAARPDAVLGILSAVMQDLAVGKTPKPLLKM